MKKVVFTMIVALVCLSASAQKGKFGVGLNANFSPCIEKGASVNNFGLSGKVQYNFTDGFRAELQAGYDFKNKGISLFHAAANFHYLFNITEKFKFYPIVGVGYARLSGDWGDEVNDIIDDYLGSWAGYRDDDIDHVDTSSSANKLLVNGGVGIEYCITDNIALGLEVKYQYMKDFSRIPISIGATYKF